MKVRAFVGMPLDAELRTRIAATAARLRDHVPGVRWMVDDGVHLTLRFLGPSSPERLVSLEDPLRHAAAACHTAAAHFAGLGTFPERGAPRVLWLGASLSPALLDLQAACESAAQAAGFPREPRRFHPHVTLGRWRGRATRPSLPPADLGVTVLRSLVLFRSELKPTGAAYSPLATFPVGCES